MCIMISFSHLPPVFPSSFTSSIVLCFSPNCLLPAFMSSDRQMLGRQTIYRCINKALNLGFVEQTQQEIGCLSLLPSLAPLSLPIRSLLALYFHAAAIILIYL